MKKLLFVLLIAVAGCSSDDPSPKNFTSLKGNWTFSQDDVSGQFKVGENSMGELIILSGTFTLSGHKYTIDYQTDIESSMCDNCLAIVLLDDSGSNISFTYSTYSVDFKTISNEGYFYTDGVNYVEVNESIEITR